MNKPMEHKSIMIGKRIVKLWDDAVCIGETKIEIKKDSKFGLQIKIVQNNSKSVSFSFSLISKRHFIT